MGRPINRRGQPKNQLATTRSAGLLSVADKRKLDALVSESGPLLSNQLPGSTELEEAGSVGTSEEAARADHTHEITHGDQLGGSRHAVATQLSAGFMSTADKLKLDNLTSGGGGGSNQVYVWNESPTGLRDGNNDLFTLNQSPVPASSLLLFKNGLLMRSGASSDYTLSGNEITFTSTAIPESYDLLLASYCVGITLYVHVFAESPVGSKNSINRNFDLVDSPVPTGSLLLFKNGILQRTGSGNDYTLSGLTITFESPSIPESPDTLVAYYTKGIDIGLFF